MPNISPWFELASHHLTAFGRQEEDAFVVAKGARAYAALLPMRGSGLFEEARDARYWRLKAETRFASDQDAAEILRGSPAIWTADIDGKQWKLRQWLDYQGLLPQADAPGRPRRLLNLDALPDASARKANAWMRGLQETFCMTYKPQKGGYHMEATLCVEESRFILLEGSQVIATEFGKPSAHTAERLALRELGVLADDPAEAGRWVFTCDAEFHSGSLATAVVRGVNCAPDKGWRVQGTNELYQDWQARHLSIHAIAKP